MAVKEDFTGPPRELLGKILVNRHIVTEEQLEHALKVQKKEKEYIGEILIKLGYANERDIVVALVVQCNIPYIAISHYDVDKKILQLIDKNMAVKNCVIALDRVGNVLSVVMANPLDATLRAELYRLTGCSIAPFIATREEINKAIEHNYK